MVVDAINDNARGFFEQFGFTRLSDDDSPRLFLPLQSINL
jgi:N-acetylglutamate synthase-like GNAT family acetyltransferase